MVRYWRATARAGLAAASGDQRRSARSRPASSPLLVIQTKFLAGRLGGRRSRSRSSSLGFYAINRHYRKVARRLRAGVGGGRGRAAGDEPGRALRRVVRRGAARGASGTRARSPATTSTRSTSRAPQTRHRHPAAVPAARRTCAPTSRSSSAEDGRVDAVIDHLWALPRGESQLRHGRHPGAVPSGPRSSRRSAGAPSSR